MAVIFMNPPILSLKKIIAIPASKHQELIVGLTCFPPRMSTFLCISCCPSVSPLTCCKARTLQTVPAQSVAVTASSGHVQPLNSCSWVTSEKATLHDTWNPKALWLYFALERAAGRGTHQIPSFPSTQLADSEMLPGTVPCWRQVWCWVSENFPALGKHMPAPLLLVLWVVSCIWLICPCACAWLTIKTTVKFCKFI